MITASICAAFAWLFLFLYEMRNAKAGFVDSTARNPFFAVGTGLLLASFALAVVSEFEGGRFLCFPPLLRIIIGSILSTLSVLFYAYILFFSFGKGKLTTDPEIGTYQNGLYAKCRHPGFYAFLFVSLSLAFLSGRFSVFAFCLAQTAVNTIYIITQDRIFFPKYIKGYTEYRKSVRFL